ncbi:GNAT family N-acetyltransferase [Streptomyces sp. NPDC002990]
MSLRGTRLGQVLIAPEARGRGLGGALVPLVVERAFGGLGLRETDLCVRAHNTAAVRTYQRLGFRTEQVVKDVEEVDGALRSALEMRLIRPDR